ncbi:hypothetical protein C5167_028870 [Papaver somniferum]|uniref:heavy metal-associated isoprenylated plant protein 3-like n=1 Tax=Papaver somniferum TaxID=3469 RepID=UPI000E6FE1EC|nr:heavy metal-associated isoprenylated plant protein 3-like [Papaver somniferum]RZC91039.1 hypothetical protein C5167_028870 [Papaver somniferum]
MGEMDTKNEKPVAETKKEEKKSDGGAKKDDGIVTVVLKIDMHCEGCAKKVKKSVSHFEGVEEVQGDIASNKLTVKGKVDPVKIKEKLEQKTKKKVEIISPLPPKKVEGGGEKKVEGGDKKKEEKKVEEKPAEKKTEEKKTEEKKTAEKKTEEKKPKEAPVVTVVLKIRLHCEGCITKIRKIITKYKGVQEVKIGNTKDLVTVKGTMDVKSLTPYLKEKLKRSVDIVPPPAAAAPKKDDGGKKEGGGGGEKKEGGGGEKKEDGGGEKKEGGGEKKDSGEKKDGGEKKNVEVKAAGGGGDGNKKGDQAPAQAGKAEVGINKMDYYAGQGGYGYANGYGFNPGYGAAPGYAFPGPVYGSGPGYAPGPGVGYSQGPGYGPGPGYVVEYVHAPQIFSDENPNACSVM